MIKKLIFVLALISTPILAATEFRLKFTDPTQIEFNAEDWVKVSREDVYDLYISKDAVSSNQSKVKVHSMVIFHEPKGRELSGVLAPVKKIYSFGMMDCKEAILYLVTDLFVDVNEQVIYMQNHDFGDYRVDLKEPNTARNAAFLKVCSI
jgi:hypothetical protein